MKRKTNLYENTYKIKNIESAFNEVCRNTKNKKKVEEFKQNRCLYTSRIYNIMKNRTYKVGNYNKFIIHEPKERVIISQNMQDKIINHLVTRQILYPAIMPCHLDHYIKEELKIKYYVRYQDDMLLFHENKEYLQECLQKIKIFLEKDVNGIIICRKMTK